jgi:hypothetical protein
MDRVREQPIIVLCYIRPQTYFGQYQASDVFWPISGLKTCFGQYQASAVFRPISGLRCVLANISPEACFGQYQASDMFWPISGLRCVLANIRPRTCFGQYQASDMFWPIPALREQLLSSATFTKRRVHTIFVFMYTKFLLLKKLFFCGQLKNSLCRKHCMCELLHRFHIGYMR